MSLRDIALIVIVGAGGYWAYTNFFQGQQGSYQDLQWKKNADVMTKCIQREESLARMQGNTGMVPETGNIESACAHDNGLYFDNGHWHKY